MGTFAYDDFAAQRQQFIDSVRRHSATTAAEAAAVERTVRRWFRSDDNRFYRLTLLVYGAGTVLATRHPQVETIAITYDRSGGVYILANPDFVGAVEAAEADAFASAGCDDDTGTLEVAGTTVRVPRDQGRKAAEHEAAHDLWDHVRRGSRSPSALKTLAHEAWLVADQRRRDPLDNEHVVVVRSDDGYRLVSVGPKQVWADYAEAVDDPLPYQRFYSDDATTLRELARMPEPPEGDGSCGRPSDCPASPSDGPGCADGDGHDCLVCGDAAAEGRRRAIDRAVRQVARDAAGGDSDAERTLREAMAATGAETDLDAQAFWAQASSGATLGQTVGAVAADPLVRLLEGFSASALDDTRRLAYDQAKPFSVRQGRNGRHVTFEPRLGYVRPTRRRRVLAFLDTSGSHAPVAAAAVRSVFGWTDRIDLRLFSFSDEVHELTDDDPTVDAWGGTNLRAVDDEVRRIADEAGREPDAVVVFSDALGEPFDPSPYMDPARWLWVVPPFGDDWPARTGMQVAKMDLAG